MGPLPRGAVDAMGPDPKLGRRPGVLRYGSRRLRPSPAGDETRDAGNGGNGPQRRERALPGTDGSYQIMDRVLWGDRDFEDEELVLGLDPAVGRHLKRQMGIDRDYYTDVAPEPTDEQLALIIKKLRSPCGRPTLGDGIDDRWY